MKGKNIWIVIADGGRARFFRTNGTLKDLSPALDHELVSDRRYSRDINADRPGRTKDRIAHGRHAYEPPTDPHENEEIEFAREVARLLDEERKKQAFDEAVLIAPPKALGRIRDAMSRELRKLVTREVDKDLTKLKLHELPKRLAQLL